jgi:hypothetical protein
MSSALEDAVAELIGADPASFASLPLPLAQRIFLALPPDTRGRACCVCRAWRDALAEPALWTRLEMSNFAPRRLLSVLHGAAGRARGQLCALDLSRQHVARDVLLQVLTAYAGSLREVHVGILTADAEVTAPLAVTLPRTASVAEVMAAAPLLQVLKTSVSGMWETAPRVLRKEPPFAALELLNLGVKFSPPYPPSIYGGIERVAPFAAALADAALQPTLSRVSVNCADTAQPAVMGALVDAALARRLRKLTFFSCSPPAAVPLARLLAEGSLAFLEVGLSFDGEEPLPVFDAAAAALVADALRINRTLMELRLAYAFLCVDMRVAVLLLGGLVGHPSLRLLRFVGERTTNAEDGSAFGAALAALIAADAAELQVLECCDNHCLGDAGLAPIVEALALNRHLRKLDVSNTDMSEVFARDRLLPALQQANTTLREFKCVGDESGPAAAEAERLVRLRAQHV